jgi:hypothetical protein
MQQDYVGKSIIDDPCRPGDVAPFRLGSSKFARKNGVRICGFEKALQPLRHLIFVIISRLVLADLFEQ